MLSTHFFNFETGNKALKKINHVHYVKSRAGKDTDREKWKPKSTTSKLLTKVI